MESLEEQTERVLANLRAKANPLEQYRYLSALQNENETLFYRVALDHLEETLPIIYTPTVGQACLAWSRLFERPRGLYISAAQHAGRVADLLRDWPRRAGIIVVTDGGRILGLGDLGANGMGIPIGKLALYTTCAGVAPEVCLPVTLDVGTDVESVRNDAMYLGDRRPRLTGEAYDAFLEEFVTPRRSFFPGPSFSSRTSTTRAPFACCGGTRTGCAASTTMCRGPVRWGWPGCIRRAESPGGH